MQQDECVRVAVHTLLDVVLLAADGHVGQNVRESPRPTRDSCTQRPPPTARDATTCQRHASNCMNGRPTTTSAAGVVAA